MPKIFLVVNGTAIKQHQCLEVDIPRLYMAFKKEIEGTRFAWQIYVQRPVKFEFKLQDKLQKKWRKKFRQDT